MLTTAAMAGLASALVPRRRLLGQVPPAASATPMPLRPPRLQPGDRVGIISPAGATLLQREQDIVTAAIRELGLVPVLGPHARDRYGYLAGVDSDRAADVNQFFADPAIKALMPIRGDWGSARILPYLDYGIIRENPKIIVGFSDITALLLGIYAKTGLITFHGPHGLTSWAADQTQPFRRVLFDGAAVSIEAVPTSDISTPARVITPGQARGPLIGGNLSVISGILGSPYMPNLDGAILVLEDIGEAIYRIDRMMTQLKLAGALDNLAGFVFGQCTRCASGDDDGSLTLEQVLRDHLQPLGIPAWSGAILGHVEPLLTVPIGIEVTMDASRGTIQMMQPAVE